VAVHQKVVASTQDIAQTSSKWELQLDDKWIPFTPGVRYNDRPGVQQDLFYRNTWYRLIFDAGGTTGTQINLSTRKVRFLRQVQASVPASLEQVVSA